MFASVTLSPQPPAISPSCFGELLWAADLFQHFALALLQTIPMENKMCHTNDA
jgi:hypothetical protein